MKVTETFFCSNLSRAIFLSNFVSRVIQTVLTNLGRTPPFVRDSLACGVDGQHLESEYSRLRDWFQTSVSWSVMVCSHPLLVNSLERFCSCPDSCIRVVKSKRYRISCGNPSRPMEQSKSLMCSDCHYHTCQDRNENILGEQLPGDTKQEGPSTSLFRRHAN